jgi:hypothetical protein
MPREIPHEGEVKITPAMRKHCQALAGHGAQLVRSRITGRYRLHTVNGKVRMPYTMGLKLEEAGLVVFARDQQSRVLDGTLTDKGREVANGG